MEVYISWSSNEYIMCTVPCIVTIEVVAMEAPELIAYRSNAVLALLFFFFLNFGENV